MINLWKLRFLYSVSEGQKKLFGAYVRDWLRPSTNYQFLYKFFDDTLDRSTIVYEWSHVLYTLCGPYKHMDRRTIDAEYHACIWARSLSGVKMIILSASRAFTLSVNDTTELQHISNFYVKMM